MKRRSDERLTLVVTKKSQFSWERSNVLFVDSIARMHATLGALDVERIILDRCATADEFLHLLARLPEDIAGDVLCVRPDGGAYLSAMSRGGDRVLYVLSTADIDFYRETNGLKDARARLALTA